MSYIPCSTNSHCGICHTVSPGLMIAHQTLFGDGLDHPVHLKCEKKRIIFYKDISCRFCDFEVNKETLLTWKERNFCDLYSGFMGSIVSYTITRGQTYAVLVSAASLTILWDRSPPDAMTQFFSFSFGSASPLLIKKYLSTTHHDDAMILTAGCVCLQTAITAISLNRLKKETTPAYALGIATIAAIIAESAGYSSIGSAIAIIGAGTIGGAVIGPLKRWFWEKVNPYRSI